MRHTLGVLQAWWYFCQCIGHVSDRRSLLVWRRVRRMVGPRCLFLLLSCLPLLHFTSSPLLLPSSSFLVLLVRFARLALCADPLVRYCLSFPNVILCFVLFLLAYLPLPTRESTIHVGLMVFSCSVPFLVAFVLSLAIYSPDCPPSSALNSNSRSATQRNAHFRRGYT